MVKDQFGIPGFCRFDTLGNSNNFIGRIKPKSGGFQAMGLSSPVLNGIIQRGYKVPTPIQRKTIPLILEGRDVVGMASTGSGKTACFLIPMFEKLKRRDLTTGARALIVCPTRELAIQTFKFIRELGKLVDLKTILVVGGDSMNSQFAAIHTCPDVIVATPGRFLHLCVEMKLNLGSIGYVVFDEADRLFEMGFGEQLNEILYRLPESKQLVLFSATLPKLLVDFANAGLNDPVLIRLDVQTKLPETLSLKFLFCRPDERYTSVIVLLKYIIPKDAQTIVFAATQYHVELLSYILNECSISNTLVYSNLDSSARKINVAKFVHKKVSVLIVTDVAARGIDIPSIYYVINLHFPGNSKLFVHRVGRCARAGQYGIAYSILSTEDQAYLLDLMLFLNRSFSIKDNESFGTIPQDILEEEHQFTLRVLRNHQIVGLRKTSENAYKKYLCSRPAASADSNKRVKQINFFTSRPLQDFLNLFKKIQEPIYQSQKDNAKELGEDKFKIVLKMKNYKPTETIFELNPHKSSVSLEVMKQKRLVHSKAIDKFRKNMEGVVIQDEEATFIDQDLSNKLIESHKSGEDCYSSGKIISSKKQKNMNKLHKTKKLRKTHFKDTDYFIPHQSSDKCTEEGLSINMSNRQIYEAEFSVLLENNKNFKYKPGMKKWDRIKKKMVTVQDSKGGKIKTESGKWIPATYQTGCYNEWKGKTKMTEQLHRGQYSEHKYSVNQGDRPNIKLITKATQGTGADRELKNREQIVRRRLRLEFAKKRELENRLRNAKNKKKT